MHILVPLGFRCQWYCSSTWTTNRKRRRRLNQLPAFIYSRRLFHSGLAIMDEWLMNTKKNAGKTVCRRILNISIARSMQRHKIPWRRQCSFCCCLVSQCTLHRASATLQLNFTQKQRSVDIIDSMANRFRLSGLWRQPHKTHSTHNER